MKRIISILASIALVTVLMVSAFNIPTTFSQGAGKNEEATLSLTIPCVPTKTIMDELVNEEKMTLVMFDQVNENSFFLIFGNTNNNILIVNVQESPENGSMGCIVYFTDTAIAGKGLDFSKMLPDIRS